MKTFRTFVWILATVLVLNLSGFGWGPVGHMTVAYAAYQKLTPATKKRVYALIKLNPYYKNGKWQQLIPAGTAAKDRPMMLFMIAATWPDQIKDKNSGYTNDPLDGATSSQNIGYADNLQHRYWHFVDTPFSQDGSELAAIPAPNAETQIAAFRATLASGDPDALKSYDLVWLLHLVGDLHQPLHSATRVSKLDPTGDKGGNKVALCKKPCKTELHGYWDDIPGSKFDPNAAVTLGKLLPKADPTLAVDTKTATWIAESFDEAQKVVYVDPPIGTTDGPFTLTASYRTAARKLAKRRVSLAGARLANVLNNELK